MKGAFKMKSKRIVAYILDIVIIGCMITVLTLLFQNANMKALDLEVLELNTHFLAKEINFSAYLNHYSSIMHDMDRQKSVITFLSIVLMFFYYVIIPYKKNGQTLGKKIMKIQVVKKPTIEMKDYIIRSFIINGLGYLILTFVFLWILPSFSYFLTISILALLQIILVIASLFMVLYNKTNKSLEDILTGTEVVPLDEVKK